jgi:hypothetical protein
MLLQQQLEQLHQQHQHRQQQQQQEQQHAQQLPQQGFPEGLEPLPTAQGDSSAALVQQDSGAVQGQPQTSWQGGCSKHDAEHYAQLDAATQLPMPQQHHQQLTAGCVEQANGRHGMAVLHSNGSTHDVRSSTAMPASSRGRAQPQQAAASGLGVAPAFSPQSSQEQLLKSNSRCGGSTASTVCAGQLPLICGMWD